MSQDSQIHDSPHFENEFNLRQRSLLCQKCLRCPFSSMPREDLLIKSNSGNMEKEWQRFSEFYPSEMHGIYKGRPFVISRTPYRPQFCVRLRVRSIDPIPE